LTDIFFEPTAPAGLNTEALRSILSGSQNIRINE
jgi:hypothetical protein